MKNFREILKEDTNTLMKPTVEWMAMRYNELNQELFNGKLGDCNFGLFTTGNGSNGRVLGWFRITGKNLKVSRTSRRIYKLGIWGDKEYINRDNFVALCKPKIELNGNYRWTEKAAISTLVHEMCHYYCEMNGYYPTRHHGTEFKQIAAYVSAKSNNFFTVERLAKAEQMSEMELNSDIAARNQQRKENKQNKIILLFIFCKNGTVRLINAINILLVKKITDTEIGKDAIKIIMSTDPNLKQEVFSKGYRQSMSTYRYWDVTNQPFVKNLGNYTTTTLYSIESSQPIPVEKPKTSLISHFRFNTNKGIPFDAQNVTRDELKAKIKERFPQWSNEVIERLLNTEKYYVK